VPETPFEELIAVPEAEFFEDLLAEEVILFELDRLTEPFELDFGAPEVITDPLAFEPEVIAEFLELEPEVIAEEPLAFEPEGVGAEEPFECEPERNVLLPLLEPNFDDFCKELFAEVFVLEFFDVIAELPETVPDLFF